MADNILVVKSDGKPQKRPPALLVVDGLYIAGAQRHCLDILDALTDDGLTCIVLALEGGGQWADEFKKRARILLVNTDKSINWVTLTNIVESNHFAFISSHLVTPISWVARNVPISIPRYAHLHSEPSEHEVVKWEWLVSTLTKFDKVFFPCITTQVCYEKALGSSPITENIKAKFKVLPNGVPHSFGNARTREIRPRRSDNLLRIAVISRLDSDKLSLPLLLETLTALENSYPLFEMVVAGDGECKQELVDSIADTSVRNKVKLKGSIKNIQEIYAWTDVVFLPSKRESMPYVLLECIANRIPLVAPRLGIFVEIIPNALVWTFSPNDPLLAARMIISAASELPENLSRSAAALLNTFLSFDKWSTLIRRNYEP